MKKLFTLYMFLISGLLHADVTTPGTISGDKTFTDNVTVQGTLSGDGSGLANVTSGGLFPTATDGTDITIKKGDKIYNGYEFSSCVTCDTDPANYGANSANLTYTPNLSGVSDGTKWLYVNLQEASSKTLTNGRLVRAVEGSDFHFSDQDPYSGNISLSLYAPVGFFNVSSETISDVKNISVSTVSFANITIDNEPCGTVKWSSTDLTETEGYLLADGDAVNRSAYPCLFDKYNTQGLSTYGIGDGSTTFNLPNIEGKSLVGYDSAQTEFDAVGKDDVNGILREHSHSGTALGVSTSGTGESRPTTTHTHSMPAHKHQTGQTDNAPAYVKGFNSSGSLINMTAWTAVQSGTGIAAPLVQQSGVFNWYTKDIDPGDTNNDGGGTAVAHDWTHDVTGSTDNAGDASSTLNVGPYITMKAYVKWTYPASGTTTPTGEHTERITAKNTSGTDSKHLITFPSGWTNKNYSCNFWHVTSDSRREVVSGLEYDGETAGQLTVDLDALTIDATQYLDVVCELGAKPSALPIDDNSITKTVNGLLQAQSSALNNFVKEPSTNTTWASDETCTESTSDAFECTSGTKNNWFGGYFDDLKPRFGVERVMFCGLKSIASVDKDDPYSYDLDGLVGQYPISCKTGKVDKRIRFYGSWSLVNATGMEIYFGNKNDGEYLLVTGILTGLNTVFRPGTSSDRTIDGPIYLNGADTSNTYSQEGTTTLANKSYGNNTVNKVNLNDPSQGLHTVKIEVGPTGSNNWISIYGVEIINDANASGQEIAVASGTEYVKAKEISFTSKTGTNSLNYKGYPIIGTSRSNFYFYCM